MTSYQRGNRDGLLSFAAWCEERAEAARAQEAWWSTKDGFTAEVAADVENGRASAFAEAAQQARKAAEALPEDPEEPVNETRKPAGCPRCAALEVESMTPRTVYACGSSSYDDRPGTWTWKCEPGRKEPCLGPEDFGGTDFPDIDTAPRPRR